MMYLSLLLAFALAAQSEGESGGPPGSPTPPEAANPDRALAEYNALRAKAGPSAAAQWRLALWCEKNGLRAEAIAHFSEVARLDPRRDAVWRKLGYKKVGGRWTTDQVLAEEKEQKAADRLWGPKLRRIHADLHGTRGPDRQAEAQAALDAIREPRAVLSLYREFGRGRLDQAILIQALDRIESPMATKMMAFLAIYGAAPQVRKQATLSLRSRPDRDYLDLLVSFLVDPINYVVRHVGGPGSPGVIVVEGERFNSARYYAPPAAPDVTPLPGDVISFDADGSPSVLRPVASLSGSTTRGLQGSKTLVQETTTETTEYAVISPGQLEREARRGAVSAEVQLRSDEREIKSINSARRQFNEVVMAVARDASGKDFGLTPKDWRESLAGANKQSPRTAPDAKPVIPEQVALAYDPWFGPSGFFTQVLTRTRIFEDS